MDLQGNEFYMNGQRLDILQTRWNRDAGEVLYLAKDGTGKEWTITLPILRAEEGSAAFYRVNLSGLVGEHGPELQDLAGVHEKLTGLKSASIDISGYFQPHTEREKLLDEVVVISDSRVEEGGAYVVPKRLDNESMEDWFHRCFKLEMNQAMADAINAVSGGEMTAEEAADAIEKQRDKEAAERGVHISDHHFDPYVWNDRLCGYIDSNDQMCGALSYEHEHVHPVVHDTNRWEDDGGAGS